MKYFVRDGKFSIGLENFKTVQDNLTQIRNLCSLTRFTSDQRLLVDKIKADSTPWFDMQCYMLSANFDCINKCLSLCHSLVIIRI